MLINDVLWWDVVFCDNIQKGPPEWRPHGAVSCAQPCLPLPGIDQTHISQLLFSQIGSIETGMKIDLCLCVCICTHTHTHTPRYATFLIHFSSPVHIFHSSNHCIHNQRLAKPQVKQIQYSLHQGSPSGRELSVARSPPMSSSPNNSQRTCIFHLFHCKLP